MRVLNDDLLETWVTGWAQARGYQTRREGRFLSAFLHDRTNDWEYFALEPSHDEFAALASSARKSPGRLFTIVTSSMNEIHGAALVHGLSVRSADEVFMFLEMAGQDIEDPVPLDGFETETVRGQKLGTVIVTADGEPAARGSVAVVDDLAVYDRIITEPQFRRRGLGSYVMRALTAVALEHDVDAGLLVTTPEGLELYRYLGWENLASVVMFEPKL
ncbi:GNAT family N-acetyltransferase [Arthrobacter sp. zg-Y820]|uniref:GNAT family N-acetyltransferase n=1 Tax=unclassified Arthrobacter TaxID=235627 RepID=UPI001E605E1B|nr:MULTISPECIES: GNAT family N-acetyltransferase [unclassified Arthrobacter]MCC9195567.1 GNAT family N-acetyltransferase [Arthrobacter sp. zg-Y820]MDK1278426.1 GNAT family N-acetyltransferase [Arthrobacter sp. zg.Y820]MDK1359969.1 GNAT family N-acetyltransferase [Arthrobacter sp. zg-Y1219]WIB09134.1 GNAT family N-acetyltransferase [Arthrobacter sp. zg-Y820]